MYTVQIEKECECFKKSEYTNNTTFKTQQDAYNYANILTELMNEEFCGKHAFSAHRAEDNTFVISLAVNLDAVEGYNPHITCDVGCGSTDNWTLESTDKSGEDSCGTNCGCS